MTFIFYDFEKFRVYVLYDESSVVHALSISPVDQVRLHA
jgi:hypothetical protein